MAEKAKHLRETEGILATPALKKGKKLSNVIVDKIIEWYESDVNSRIMANKKDTVSIKINGKKEKKTKTFITL